MPNEPRLAVRAMLIDNESRLLLLKGHDSTIADSHHWWFTVGGGILPGETPEEAIGREVFEETGQQVDNFMPTPFSRTSSFYFEDRQYHQHERFFTARLPSFSPNPRHLTPMERRSILGHKWWSLEELMLTRERVYPPQLNSWFAFILKSSHMG